jgi:ABC-type sugar transport system ATPase subunit
VQLHGELRTTMIFVTHDQDEAMTIADRIAVMREGRVVQIAAALDIYRDPVDLWVAEFIGGHPINVLRVFVGDGRARLFDANGDPLDLPAAIADELVRVRGSSGEIVLGVRPELVQVRSADGLGAATGKILTRQLHGTEILYEVELERGVLRAVVPSLPGTEVFAHGDAVSLDFRWAGVFAFAADSGARLRPEFAPGVDQATRPSA